MDFEKLVLSKTTHAQPWTAPFAIVIFVVNVIMRQLSTRKETTKLPWHTTVKIADGLYQISEPFGAVVPQVGVRTVNMYLVIGRERAALIDSGMGIDDASAEIRKLTDVPCSILNTHYHWDHIGANSLFSDIAIHEREVDLLNHEPDVNFVREAMQTTTAQAVLPAGFDPTQYRVMSKPATHYLRNDELIDLGGRELRVLPTPGHSPGHVAYMDETNGVLFTGDAAYQGPLYACFARSNPRDFARSVRRLAGLTNVRLICPGHNELITAKGWLNQLAECVEAAVTGDAEGQLREGFVVGRYHDFGAVSVWLPQ